MSTKTINVEFRESWSDTLHSVELVVDLDDDSTPVKVAGHTTCVDGVWARATDTERGVRAYHYAKLVAFARVAAAHNVSTVRVTL